ARPDGAHQIGRRVARIQGSRGGAARHDPQVGQTEFGPGLRIERHHVAFTDADGAQARGDLLDRLLVFVPTVGAEAASAYGLQERRRIAVFPGSLFEYLINRARVTGHGVGSDPCWSTVLVHFVLDAHGANAVRAGVGGERAWQVGSLERVKRARMGS